jgi:pSer/pThr/pTyr-binding forkhead associated (FHA) protein
MIGVFHGTSGRIARLEAIAGSRTGQSYDVPRTEFTIGANDGNQLVLSEDGTVSGRHASLVFEEPILMLVDRSTNGTRVNGELVKGTRRPVREGDLIQIGQTLFRLNSAN